ncbi:MAG: ribosome small subunit-dependent GTPase A [Prevotella sp.]|nr:ribosome small subunit-dependent GTPase A [Prevotella sp.]MCM1075136.1 ribosome small subunit-dependent GTPase A [Ruminococcus sp.]
MNEFEGTVIRNTGSWLDVLPETGGVPIHCKVKGNFRIKGIRTTNPVAVGDRVKVSIMADDTGFITAVLPRRNYIIRRATNLSKECHILAANLDQTLLVATLHNPDTPTTFIDRFLATAEAYNVPAVLVLNKADTWNEEDRELADALSYLYTDIGYPVIFTSAKTGEGIDRVQSAIKDKVTLLAGNSGVGKSSLINALIPGLDLRTGDISSSHHTGMHTTTFSEMFALPEGGALIDIPGVKGFGTIDFDPAEVSHYFPEIFKTRADCRFQNCTHTHEPGCAVRSALEEHRIAQSRYASYLSILEDANPEKYRKPF